MSFNLISTLTHIRNGQRPPVYKAHRFFALRIQTKSVDAKSTYMSAHPTFWANMGNPTTFGLGGPMPTAPLHHMALAGSKDLEPYWQGPLGMYMIRKITYNKDRPKAVMGLAKQVTSSDGAAKAQMGDYYSWFMVLQPT